jgi:hypothetical protein
VTIYIWQIALCLAIVLFVPWGLAIWALLVAYSAQRWDKDDVKIVRGEADHNYRALADEISKLWYQVDRSVKWPEWGRGKD